MIIKLLAVVFSIVSMVQTQCSFTIGGGGDGTQTVKLSVPYFYQECNYWCAPACIKMWALHGGALWSQQEIATYLGGLGSYGAEPRMVERAVGVYTCSTGWLEQTDAFDYQGKRDLIASTICGIEYGTPSIIPVDGGSHVVLIVGHKWYEQSDGRPVAVNVWIHDPWTKVPYEMLSSIELNRRFDCGLSQLWAIVGESAFIWEGIDGHEAFIEAGGLYYPGQDPQTVGDFVAIQ